MPKVRVFFFYWLPVLAWMVVIFIGSSDSHSFQRSSHIIEPIIRWLTPNLPDDAVHTIVVLVRKASHVTEYAILAGLVLRALRKSPADGQRYWKTQTTIQTLLLVMLYACTDEFHQRFVPTREASVTDVFIDTGGAILALLLLWILRRWRKSWCHLHEATTFAGDVALRRRDPDR